MCPPKTNYNTLVALSTRRTWASASYYTTNSRRDSAVHTDEAFCSPYPDIHAVAYLVPNDAANRSPDAPMGK